MKKLITILAIMIVLASAVFAVEPVGTRAASTGTAAIDVKATVATKYPVFQLKIGSTASRAVTATPAITFTTDAAQPSAGNEYNANAIVDTLLAQSGTASLTFNINQISNSRCNTTYDLSVTASDLVLVKSETGAADPIERELWEVIDVDGAYSGSEAATERFQKASVTLAPAAIAAPNTNKVVPSVTNNILTATYNGANVVATEMTIGTAVVAWTANADAKAGDYKARVILTVEAN